MAVNQGEIGIYGVLKRDGGDGIIVTADQVKDTTKNATLAYLNEHFSEAKLGLDEHLMDQENPHNVTKEQVGLDNVTNDAQVKRDEMGKASGVATLDSTGKVPASLLPSFVDDVLEYSTLSEFPAKGEEGKIYVTLDTNLTYRWSSTQYIEISPSLAVGETANSAFAGSRGVAVEKAVQLEVTDRTNAISTLNLSINDTNTNLSNYKTEVANNYLPITGGTIKGKTNENTYLNLTASSTSISRMYTGDMAELGFDSKLKLMQMSLNVDVMSYTAAVDSLNVYTSMISDHSMYGTRLVLESITYNTYKKLVDFDSYTINTTIKDGISTVMTCSNASISFVCNDSQQGIIIKGKTSNDVLTADGGTKTIGTDIASQAAVNSKVAKTTTINNKSLSSNITLDKSDIGLANVDNTSDLDKPISTAMLAALDKKYLSTVERNAGTFLAAPSDTNGVAVFRKIVESDLSDAITVCTTDEINALFV